MKRFVKKRTLLIGLGGTGRDTVNFLYERLQARHKDLTEVPVGTVIFDLDELRKEQKLGLTASYQKLDQHKVNQKAMNMQLPENELYWSWYYDKNNQYIDIREIRDGAGQWRPVGRLGYTENIPTIQQRLQRAIARLKGMHTLDLSDEDIDVYIISSIAGGTGSGLLFDIAFHLQEEVSRRDTTSFRLRTYGFLVLPEVFAQLRSIDRVFPNAYATLKEARAFSMKDSPFYAFDPINGERELNTSEHQPFDQLFLFDVETGSTHFTHPAQCFRFIANCLYIRLITPTAEDINTVLTNRPPVARGKDGRLQDQTFSSMGAALLRIPSEEEIVKHFLLGKHDTDEDAAGTSESQGADDSRGATMSLASSPESTGKDILDKVIGQHIDDFLLTWFGRLHAPVKGLEEEVSSILAGKTDEVAGKRVGSVALQSANTTGSTQSEQEEGKKKKPVMVKPQKLTWQYQWVLDGKDWAKCLDVDWESCAKEDWTSTLNNFKQVFQEKLEDLAKVKVERDRMKADGQSLFHVIKFYKNKSEELETLLKGMRERTLPGQGAADLPQLYRQFEKTAKNFRDKATQEVKLYNKRIATIWFQSPFKIHHTGASSRGALEAIREEVLPIVHEGLTTFGFVHPEKNQSGEIKVNREAVLGKEAEAIQEIEHALISEVLPLLEQVKDQLKERVRQLEECYQAIEEEFALEKAPPKQRRWEKDAYSSINELSMQDFFDKLRFDGAPLRKVLSEVLLDELLPLENGVDNLHAEIKALSKDDITKLVDSGKQKLADNQASQEFKIEYASFIMLLRDVMVKAGNHVFTNLRNVASLQLVYYSFPKELEGWFPQKDQGLIEEAIVNEISQHFGSARPIRKDIDEPYLIVYQEEHFQPSENISGIRAMQRAYQRVPFPQQLLHTHKKYVELPELVQAEFKVVLCGNHDCHYNIAHIPRNTHFCPSCSRTIKNRCGNEDCHADNLLELLGGAIDKTRTVCPACFNKIKTLWWECGNHHGVQFRDPDNHFCPECSNQVISQQMFFHERSRRDDDLHYRVFCIHCQESPHIPEPFVLPVPGWYEGVPAEHQDELDDHLAKANVKGNNCPVCATKLYPESPYHIEQSPLKYFDLNQITTHLQHTDQEIFHCYHCLYPVDDHEGVCPRCKHGLQWCDRCSSKGNHDPHHRRYKVEPIKISHEREICPCCQFPFTDPQAERWQRGADPRRKGLEEAMEWSADDLFRNHDAFAKADGRNPCHEDCHEKPHKGDGCCCKKKDCCKDSSEEKKRCQCKTEKQQPAHCTCSQRPVHEKKEGSCKQQKEEVEEEGVSQEIEEVIPEEIGGPAQTEPEASSKEKAEKNDEPDREEGTSHD